MHALLHSSRSRYRALFLWLAATVNVQAVVLPFEETFEAGLSNWSTSGSWGLTSLDSQSPTHAATDSPTGYYVDQADGSLTLSSSFSLSGATRPALRFWHRYDVETGYDFARVESTGKEK